MLVAGNLCHNFKGGVADLGVQSNPLSQQKNQNHLKSPVGLSHRLKPKPVVIAVGAAVIVVALVAVFLLIPKGPAVKDALNDYSWEEISEISKIISSKGDHNGAIEVAKKYHLCTEDGKLNGHQTKSVKLSDGTSAEVMIADFNHDDKSDGSGKAGITFIFTNSVDKQNMYNESDLDEVNSHKNGQIGWKTSSLRKWLSDSFYSELPSDLKNQIVTVNKPYASYSTSQGSHNGDKSGVTSDKLWIPSYPEVARKKDFFASERQYSKQGSQYQVYSDVGVKNNYGNDVFGAYEGEPGKSGWWLRSYTTYGGSSEPTFSDVIQGRAGEKESGYEDDFQYFAYNEYGDPKIGVVPGFCI